MATAQKNPVQENAIARAMLLQSALPIRKKVATISGVSLGQTVRQRLLNVGLTSKISLHVRANITIGAADATKSGPAGIYGLLNQVILTDYNQIERVNTDGASLAKISSYKKRRQLGSYATPYYNAGTGVLTAELIKYPTAQAAADLEFFLDVPFCVDADAGDLRGLSLSQAVVGEQFISLKIADALENADPSLAPYLASASTFVLNSLAIDVWQEYYQPQPSMQLPILDLATVYEIKGLFRSTSDISTGGQKLINYPNVRTVFSSLHSCLDNAAGMTDTNIGSIQLMVNSSQILREDTYKSKVFEMAELIRGAPFAGDIYMNHRNSPISTAIYGNVQLALNWATIAGGTTYTNSTFESVYMAGTPLPGITTQG